MNYCNTFVKVSLVIGHATLTVIVLDYCPGALSLSQIPVTNLKKGHPQFLSTGDLRVIFE